MENHWGGKSSAGNKTGNQTRNHEGVNRARDTKRADRSGPLTSIITLELALVLAPVLVLVLALEPDPILVLDKALVSVIVLALALALRSHFGSKRLAFS